MKTATKPNNAKKYEYQERLYIKSLLEMNIALYPNQIGENKTRENLHKTIIHTIEGKCISYNLATSKLKILIYLYTNSFCINSLLGLHLLNRL